MKILTIHQKIQVVETMIQLQPKLEALGLCSLLVASLCQEVNKLPPYYSEFFFDNYFNKYKPIVQYNYCFWFEPFDWAPRLEILHKVLVDLKIEEQAEKTHY